MKRVLIVVAIVLAGCTSETDALRALKGAGYTNIELTGVALFSCSEDDWFRTGFKARGPTGQRLSGAVCSGFLKGATIRLD